MPILIDIRTIVEIYINTNWSFNSSQNSLILFKTALFLMNKLTDTHLATPLFRVKLIKQDLIIS